LDAQRIRILPIPFHFLVKSRWNSMRCGIILQDPNIGRLIAEQEPRRTNVERKKNS
jgi:hypothetical protein